MRARFLKEGLSLAVTDRRLRRPCIEKLVTSGQSGAEWASQPNQMTLTGVTESEVPTDHKLVKPISATIMLPDPVL